VKTPRKIVEALIADLTDRRGLRHEWDQIDADIREQIEDEWTRIVSDGMSAPVTPKTDPITGEPLVELTVHVPARAIELVQAEARHYQIPISLVVESAIFGRAPGARLQFVDPPGAPPPFPTPVVVEADQLVDALLDALASSTAALGRARKVVAFMRGSGK